MWSPRLVPVRSRAAAFWTDGTLHSHKMSPKPLWLIVEVDLKTIMQHKCNDILKKYN